MSKYIVIFANQAQDDKNYDPKKAIDYGFTVEADDPEEAMLMCPMPDGYDNKWLLVASIEMDELEEYKLVNDGIPLIINPNTVLIEKDYSFIKSN